MSTPSPTPPEPALQTAARLLAEGRPAAAAARLADLVAAAPTYAAAHVLRATALEAAGFVDESIVSWGRAAALVPRSPLVHRERERLMALRVTDDASGLPPAVPATPAPRPPAPSSPRAAYVEAEPPPALEGAPDEPPREEPPREEPPREEPPRDVLDLDVSDPLPDLEDVPPAPLALEDGPPAALEDGPAPASDADELDSLIARLDGAPRIRPDPSYSGPEVSLDTPEVDDLASETLAKIYAAQHQYVEAAVIYEKLAARKPDQAEALLDRAAELRRRG